MSGLPKQSLPKSGPRRLRWVLAVMIGLLVLCGLPLGIARYFHRDDDARAADYEIDRYLSLVQRRDSAGADAMLCGSDDKGTADLPGMNQPDWHLPPVESFTVVRAWDWSSVIDGHGRGYRVRLLFADSSAAEVDLAVEVIGDGPCIATEIPI